MPPAAPEAAPPAKAVLRLRTTGPTHALIGDVLPLQLTVTNTGNAEAVDVELDDSLPEGLELWAGMENGIVGKRRVWKIGRLAPGQTEVRDLQAFRRRRSGERGPGDGCGRVAGNRVLEGATWTSRS